MPGSTGVGKPKEYKGASVDVDPLYSKLIVNNIDLEKDYGWKRHSVIHTHPGDYDSKLSNWYDNTFRGIEYFGDIPYAINNNMDIFLVTKEFDFIKRFNIAYYKHVNPRGMNYRWWDVHKDASHRATDKTSIYIGEEKK